MTAIQIPSLDLFPTRKPAGAAPVTLRRVRSEDAAALQAFVRALSPTSRRLRFHMALNELPEVHTAGADLRRSACPRRLRAHLPEGAAERIVGEARYVVADDGETAEFGIAVADGFRGLGLAERLLAALIDAARTAGLRWLVGEVLAGNARMLAFVRRCGFAETTRGVEPGLVRVERCIEQPLAVAAQAAGHRTGVAHGTVSRLLAAFLPSPLDATWNFQQF